MLASAAIVFTNQRILFFPVKTDGSWKESVRTALWGDVAEVKSNGFVTRNLGFTYRNGQKETYLGFRPGDAKKIALIARTLIPVSAGETSVTHGAVQVCASETRGMMAAAVAVENRAVVMSRRCMDFSLAGKCSNPRSAARGRPSVLKRAVAQALRSIKCATGAGRLHPVNGTATARITNEDLGVSRRRIIHP